MTCANMALALASPCPGESQYYRDLGKRILS